MDIRDVSLANPHEMWHEAGSHVYREQLLQGRLIGAYRSPTGRPRSTSAIDAVIAAQLGDMALEAFDLIIDGTRLLNHWRWESVATESASDDSKHTRLTLTHEVKPIHLVVHTQTDGSPFLTRWLAITNAGPQPLALTAVAPCAGLLWYQSDYRERLSAPSPFTLGHFERHDFGHEGAFTWQPLPAGTFVTASRTGHSGWGLPFCIVRNEVTGSYFIAHLAWSGNWAMSLTLDTEPASFDGDAFWRDGPQKDVALSFQIAPTATAPHVFIAPGETITTPAVHLGMLHGELDDGIQALHTHLRRSVFAPLHPDRALLIGTGIMVQEPLQTVYATIATAADVGCEFVQIDAGWYGTRTGTWDTTVGDWSVAPWLADGLAPIRAAIQSRGMRFGLWMEPESVGRESQLLRDHADWLVRRDGVPVAGGRALDLGLAPVAAWVAAEIERVITTHKVDLFKIDFNTHVRNGGERFHGVEMENTLWRHVTALYAILARTREQHPDVVIENCASGGGRNDIGLLRYCDIGCLSDYGPAPRALQALYHLTLALPPERLRWYVGHMEDGLHEADSDGAFPWHVALFTNPLFVGFPPDVSEAGSSAAQRYRRFIQRYKMTIRPILSNCQVFHHTPVESISPWLVLEYTQPDHTRGYIGAFRMRHDGPATHRICPRGIIPSAHYHIEWETTGETALVTGWQLQQSGLQIQRTTIQASEVIFYAMADTSADAIPTKHTS